MDLSDCRYLRTVSGRFGRGWGCAAFMFGGGRTVLTIGKLGTTRGRLEYYDAQVAAGAEDYYAGRGESTGRWRGAGVRAVNLVPGGRVSRSEFLALMRGEHPADGSVLRVMSARASGRSSAMRTTTSRC